MAKAVGFLVRAVEATAVVAVLVAVIVMIDTRSLLGSPLLVLAAIAGVFSWRLGKRSTADSVSAGSREAILVS